MLDEKIENYLKIIPKVELHMHIEGSLEPDLMFSLAKRNKLSLPYENIAALKKAYHFADLQSFLNLYYQGMAVLLKEEDFYDLTMAYMAKAAQQNVCHVEIFFDPQAHLMRGVSFKTVITGITKALEDAKVEFGVSSHLIMCFLRDQSQEDALETLEIAKPYRDKIIAVGLDSAEVGNPPQKFEAVFKAAKDQGYLRVAHLGEESPAPMIWQGLELLDIQRIDHGVQSIGDEKLLQHLAQTQMPLTVCPLSNIKLCVFSEMQQHPLKKLLDKGLCVSIHSDDPAYFGGYMLENYQAVTAALDLSMQDIRLLAKNAIRASFLSKNDQQALLHKLSDCEY